VIGAGADRTARWAVVGLGRFARGRLVPALLRAPHARLAGVYTRNPDVRRAAADEHGATAYESYDALLADPGVQIVALVTPHDLHAEQAIRAAAAQKHVFVEKPMALSVPDALRMRRACEAAGVRLYVGFHLRFHGAHQYARNLVRSGRVGDPVLVSATWGAYREADTGWRLDPSTSGGALLTARGVHLLDLIRFVSGAEFSSICGESDGFRADHPADDVTAALGRLSSGAMVHVLCSRLVHVPDDTLEIIGTTGRLTCRGVLSNDEESSVVLTDASGETRRTFPKADMLAAELDHVSAAVASAASGDEIGATAEDGVRVTAVTTALIESIRGRRVVSLQ
jgi:predicted dehydrogenase